MKILGVNIDEVNRREAVEKISGWIKPAFAKGYGGAKHVVTIYSAFVLAAEKDNEFRQAVSKASLVVPDGVGVLAALRYGKGDKGLWNGLRVGWEGLMGDLGEPVTGVWLFEELVGLAANHGWKVFLLGGYGDTASRLAAKLKRENPKLKIEFDAGEQGMSSDKESKQENRRVIEKINKYKPDLLMVSYGPRSQEKWIYKNKKRLKVRVAIGLGGTFDEVLGLLPRTPVWMEKRGLKALWRLMIQPKRLPRIWRGMVVFPWKVYRGK